MADQKNLQRAYDAIAVLRARTGRAKLSVAEVQRESGISRATLYLADEDWKRVREVIAGAPDPRVKPILVNEVAPTEKRLTRLQEIEQRASKVEAELADLVETNQAIYESLLDQVQEYYALSLEAQKQKKNESKSKTEVNRLKQENEILKAELRQYKIAQRKGDVVAALAIRRTIDLTAAKGLSAMYAQLLKQLDQLIPDKQSGLGIAGVYLLCGLPLAGKTTWIEKHKPDLPGTYIYIDADAHSREVRGFIAEQVRRYTFAPLHCVRLRASAGTCLERSKRLNNMAAHVQIEQRLLSAQREFEEVTAEEPFDFITLAGDPR